MNSQTITLKSDINIHYYTAGGEGNPTLLLLHGWPSSALLWRLLIPELSKHFFILCPDLPGHGYSSKPRDAIYDKDFLSRFILEFLDALAIDQAHLGCHDLGGTAALVFASRYPGRINKFIVMNTSPYADWHWRLRFTIFLLKQPMLTSLFLNPFVFKQVLKSGLFNHQLITKELIDVFRRPWLDSKEAHASFSKTIAVPPEDLALSKDELKQIKLPTLVLWGKKDIFFPMQVARQLHKDIPGSKLIGVDSAAHFLQEEQPEFIQKEMIEFLAA